MNLDVKRKNYNSRLRVISSVILMYYTSLYMYAHYIVVKIKRIKRMRVYMFKSRSILCHGDSKF